jgi:uncharacterized protein (DUF1015 family)
MAEIVPFKGVLYNSENINNDYAGVCAPPYDVISTEEQDQLYNKSEHNIIRLILGKSSAADNDDDNKYIRAEQDMSEWLSKDILSYDGEEAYYVYMQEYKVDGVDYRRVGFLGLMKIEQSEGDEVLPHERTLAKPKQDRMNLIKRVKSNLSPIFTLFSDTSGKISEILETTVSGSDPIIDIDLADGRHMLWRLVDINKIQTVSDIMSDKKVFIADGHHRYTVARNYRDIMKENADYDGNADYIMMYFADMTSDKNLTVMATHRVLKTMPDAAIEHVSDRLKGAFDLEICDSLEVLMSKLDNNMDKHAFGFYGGDRYLFIKAEKGDNICKAIAGDKSDAWKELDASILHEYIYKQLLGIIPEEGGITYVKSPEDGVRLVSDGSHKGAFFMNPTRVDQLKAVAETGDMMPQKSTYFYPKLLTGLVIHKFEEN